MKKDYTTKCCEGVGDKNNPKYMLVGISGGRLGCIQTGVPFTRDASGKLLIRVLHELGYTYNLEWDEKPIYSNIYVTNLVKGVILDQDGNNRTPYESEINYWVPMFKKEVQEVKPEKMVAIGRIVLETFRNIGIKHSLSLKHPSYYARNGALGKSRAAWSEMLTEYTSVLGLNNSHEKV